MLASPATQHDPALVGHSSGGEVAERLELTIASQEYRADNGLVQRGLCKGVPGEQIIVARRARLGRIRHAVPTARTAHQVVQLRDRVRSAHRAPMPKRTSATISTAVVANWPSEELADSGCILSKTWGRRR
jgi:hypothetical protein